MMFGWGLMGGWGWGLMVVQVVATGTLVVVIGLAVWQLVSGGTAPGRGGGHRSPAEVLADRLARGEIDEDEYRRRLGLLSGHAPVQH